MSVFLRETIPMQLFRSSYIAVVFVFLHCYCSQHFVFIRMPLVQVLKFQTSCAVTNRIFSGYQMGRKPQSSPSSVFLKRPISSVSSFLNGAVWGGGLVIVKATAELREWLTVYGNPTRMSCCVPAMSAGLTFRTTVLSVSCEDRQRTCLWCRGHLPSEHFHTNKYLII